MYLFIYLYISTTG